MTDQPEREVELEYRKTATIRAVQWFKPGDHPAVEPYADQHGWCPTLEGGHVVTPGDWIATGIKGEHWPIKPDVFAATYEPVSSSPPPPRPAGPTREEIAAIILESQPPKGFKHRHPNALAKADAILSLFTGGRGETTR
ncbi:hypothetical protein UFOVP1288_19 [uncultured Caudovirales phage]|uniref:Uncharacterized protein n=1 Tax=uncultured Caudovirales phage TaxID=2100421 RepID=A0A6J5S842_9CAUD|nr:hypothetical protein UFOVP1195_19 [uncultured Caudovirales phage]CAB4195496.1 hypothetical protein UFOVP1288_19 [uncultured Caudovirales phage]CAB4204920.1 hypothetical protein UFOVP1409_19 [uncultured Caudovirales phage]